MDTYKSNGSARKVVSFDLKQDRQHRLEWKRLQLLLAAVILTMMFGAICMAGVFSVLVHVLVIAYSMTEFGILLFVFLCGTLVYTGYEIQSLEIEMAQNNSEDDLPRMHVRKWTDILLYTSVIIVSCSLLVGNNWLIYKLWDSDWSPFWLIGMNIGVSVFSIVVTLLVRFKRQRSVSQPERRVPGNSVGTPKIPSEISGREYTYLPTNRKGQSY